MVMFVMQLISFNSGYFIGLDHMAENDILSIATREKLLIEMAQVMFW